MKLEDLDTRQIAIIASRGRCILGLACLVAPGIVSRVFFNASTPEVRAITRFTGVRDLAIGVGSLTCLKEETQDAEWVSMGAISDMVDGVVGVAQPGLPARSRVLGVGAFGLGGYLLKLSRDLDNQRTATPTPAST